VPYRIDLHGAGDDVVERLIDLGALDVEAHARGVAALLPDTVVPEQVGRALGAARFSVAPAIGRDADSVWTLRPRPLRIGAHTLQLTDSRVFGTGLHPTTALCLELLEEIVTQDSPGSVLDVGTGSGVLAIAALALGVPRATAIDIERESVRVAGRNARRNRVGDRLDVSHAGPDQVTGAWPLVLANILAGPLMAMAPVLVRRVAHQGQMVLSGIPQSMDEEVAIAYRRLGMRHARTKVRGGWAAILLRASW
jgi:ribosomal protein L11 methyltransferase